MSAECKLVDQKDYMDIKRECEILKETQFSGVDKAKLDSQTLEALLLSQNRNLQSENSSMRKQINEINNELNNVQVRENILKNQVQNQDALIEKLEKDLLSVNALPSAYRTGGDGAASSSTSSTMIQHEFLENALKDVTQRSSALLQEVPQKFVWWWVVECELSVCKLNLAKRGDGPAKSPTVTGSVTKGAC